MDWASRLVQDPTLVARQYFFLFRPFVGQMLGLWAQGYDFHRPREADRLLALEQARQEFAPLVPDQL